MISTKLNSAILTEMSYTEPVLTIRLRGKERQYFGVEKEVAYRLFYATDPLSVFSNQIKGKYNVSVK